MDRSIKDQLSINASFELEPMLGNGEILCISEISVGDLAQAGSTYRKRVKPCPSLLITIEERRLDYFVDLSHGGGHVRVSYIMCPC